VEQLRRLPVATGLSKNHMPEASGQAVASCASSLRRLFSAAFPAFFASSLIL